MTCSDRSVDRDRAGFDSLAEKERTSKVWRFLLGQAMRRKRERSDEERVVAATRFGVWQRPARGWTSRSWEQRGVGNTRAASSSSRQDRADL